MKRRNEDARGAVKTEKAKRDDFRKQAQRRVFFGEDGDSDDAFEKVEKRAPKRQRRKKRPSRLAAFGSKLGKTEIFVTGASAVKALGALMKICSVSDVEVTPRGMSFFVPSKLLNKIVALLENLCYDYKIIGIKGVAPAVFRASTRVGIFVGIVLIAVMLAVYPCFVTRVDVTSADACAIDGALNAEVRQILLSHGIAQGKFVPKVDADSLNKELLEIDGVAYAGFVRRGTHVSVIVKREADRDELFEIDGSAVRSTALATVTRVIVEGGTAVVKYGDVVKPGDVLIDGYVTYGDDAIPVEAKGRVYGTVLLTSETIFGDTVLENTYGAVKRVSKLGFFGKEPKTPRSPYECYELEVKRSKFGFLLPMECFDYEFRELKVVESPETRSDEELCLAVYSSLLEELREEATVRAVYSDVQRSERGRTVRVTLEAEVLISDR